MVSVLTESELKEGKRMFICVKHAFAACIEMRNCNEGASGQDFSVKYDGIFSKVEVYPFADEARSLLSGNL